MSARNIVRSAMLDVLAEISTPSEKAKFMTLKELFKEIVKKI